MSKKCLALFLAISIIGSLFSGIMVYAATDAVLTDSFSVTNQPAGQVYTSSLFNGITTSQASRLPLVSVVEEDGNAVMKISRNTANTNTQNAFLKSIPLDLSGGKELIFKEKFKVSKGDANYALGLLSTSTAAYNVNKEGFLSLLRGKERIYVGTDSKAADYSIPFSGANFNTWFTYEARLKIDASGNYTVDNYVFKSNGTLFFHPKEYTSTTPLTSEEIGDLQIRTGVTNGYGTTTFTDPFELCIDDCSVITYTPSSQTPAVTTDLADLTAVPKNTTAISLEYDQAVSLSSGGNVTLYETNNTSNTVAVTATAKSFDKFDIAVTGSLEEGTSYTLEVSNIKNSGAKAAANITFTTAEPVYAPDVSLSDSFSVTNQPASQAYTSDLFNGIAQGSRPLPLMSVIEENGNAVMKFSYNSNINDTGQGYLKTKPFDLSGGKELIFREKFKVSSGDAEYRLALLCTSSVVTSNADIDIKEGFVRTHAGSERIYIGTDRFAPGYSDAYTPSSYAGKWFSYEARLKINSDGTYTVDNYVFNDDGTVKFHPDVYTSSTALTTAEIADLQIRAGVSAGFNGTYELYLDNCSLKTYRPAGLAPTVATSLVDLEAVPKNTTAISLEYDQAVALAQGGSVTLYETNDTSNTVAVTATPKSFDKFNIAITGSLKEGTSYTLEVSDIKNSGAKAASNITFTTGAPVYTPNVTLSDSFDANYTQNSLPVTSTSTYATVGENGLFEKLKNNKGTITIEPTSGPDGSSAMKFAPTSPIGDENYYEIGALTKNFDVSSGKEIIFKEDFYVDKGTGTGTGGAQGIYAIIVDDSGATIANMMCYQMYSLDSDTNKEGSPIYGKNIAYNLNTWYKYIGRFKVEEDKSYTVENYITDLDGNIIYSAGTKNGTLDEEKLTKLGNARIYTGIRPYKTTYPYIMLDNCSLTTYSPVSSLSVTEKSIENTGVSVFTNGIDLTFDRGVDTINGANVSLYETDNTLSTVSVTTRKIAFNRIAIDINSSLKVNTSYTLNISGLKDADGHAADSITFVTGAPDNIYIQSTTIPSGTTVTAGNYTINLFNGGEQCTPMILVAFYKNDAELIGLKLIDDVTLAASDTTDVPVTLDAYSNVSSKKIIVLEDFDTIKPLAKAMTIN